MRKALRVIVLILVSPIGLFLLVGGFVAALASFAFVIGWVVGGRFMRWLP